MDFGILIIALLIWLIIDRICECVERTHKNNQEKGDWDK